MHDDIARIVYALDAITSRLETLDAAAMAQTEALRRIGDKLDKQNNILKDIEQNMSDLEF